MRTTFNVLRTLLLTASTAGAILMIPDHAHAQGSIPAAAQTVESRAITVRINLAYDKAYEFLVNPINWNQWAFGLGKNIREAKGGWIADSDGGTANVRFTPRNDFGVLDHSVIRPSGQRVDVPMRLVANGTGWELIFTLFRESNMSDAQFSSDAAYVQRDLDGLKRLLEK